jgi:hypothetical protein
MDENMFYFARYANENHVSVKAFHRIILRGCEVTVERLFGSVISDGSIQKFTPRRALPPARIIRQRLLVLCKPCYWPADCGSHHPP